MLGLEALPVYEGRFVSSCRVTQDFQQVVRVETHVHQPLMVGTQAEREPAAPGPAPVLGARELTVLQCIREGTQELPALIRHTGLPEARAIEALGQLEAYGLIRSNGVGWVAVSR